MQQKRKRRRQILAVLIWLAVAGVAGTAAALMWLAPIAGALS